MITREYPPLSPYSGGIGTQFAALARGLADAGVEVEVVTQGAAGPRTLLHEGVRVHEVPLPRAMHGDLEEWSWARAADRVVRRLADVDAVYVPEYAAWGWWYSRAPAAPLIVNLQSALFQMLAVSPGLRWTARHRRRYLLQRVLERDQARRAGAVVGCSRSILDWTTRAWGLAGKPRAVLPNFVDRERVRHGAQGTPPDGFPQGRPVVSFSGRLESRKGVHVLVEAMNRVWKREPEVALVLLGADDYSWRGGLMSEHLRRLAGPFADRVFVLGNQPPERLFPALAASHVVSLPSLWEPFGLAALEAMTVGAPVVLTSGGGYEDFCASGRDGLLVPPDHPDALAAAILELLGDSALRARLGRAATQRAEEFTTARVVPRYVAFFESVIEAASTQSRGVA